MYFILVSMKIMCKRKQHADFQIVLKMMWCLFFYNTFMSAPASIEGRSQRCLNAQTNKAVVSLLEQSDTLERMLFTHYFLQSVCGFMISQITVSGRMMIRNKCSKLIFLLLRISSILIRSLDLNSYL